MDKLSSLFFMNVCHEPTRVEHLTVHPIMLWFLTLFQNIRLAWKKHVRDKHSSLFYLTFNKEENF